MKSILVYGDSLVWGRNASNRDRHKYEDRWPNILGASLKNVKVWEAGLGGRTTNLDFQGLPGRNGLKSIDKFIGTDYSRVRVGIGHPKEKKRGK